MATIVKTADRFEHLKRADASGDIASPASAPARPTRAEAEDAVRTLLAFAGDDPAREGLVDTPGRVARAYADLFSGYDGDPGEILSTVFEDVAGYDDMVLVRDIPFFSHCEHHMVPFFGHAHIAYYPQNGVVGLSKLARLVDLYARRLQTQETMTAQIASAMETHLRPKGVAILLEAEHMCMTMRGVQKPGASTVTTRFTGVFDKEEGEQRRFFTILGGGGNRRSGR